MLPEGTEAQNIPSCTHDTQVTYYWDTVLFFFLTSTLICRVGLIEWVENTKPLKDFLQAALTEEERKKFTYAC